MPGFALALKSQRVFDAHPQCEGLILHKHGIFTFGGNAREAYDAMIDLVSRAERACAECGSGAHSPSSFQNTRDGH